MSSLEVTTGKTSTDEAPSNNLLRSSPSFEFRKKLNRLIVAKRRSMDEIRRGGRKCVSLTTSPVKTAATPCKHSNTCQADLSLDLCSVQPQSEAVRSSIGEEAVPDVMDGVRVAETIPDLGHLPRFYFCARHTVFCPKKKNAHLF